MINWSFWLIPLRKYLLFFKYQLSMIIWYFNPIGICHLSSKKSQLNLLYELNQKDNFILQKFQTPPLSLSSISENCKKPNTFFSLHRQTLPPSAISLPHCAADEGTAQHRLILLQIKPSCISVLNSKYTIFSPIFIVVVFIYYSLSFHL